MPVIILFNS